MYIAKYFYVMLKQVIFAVVVSLMFASCAKEAGDGGTSSIQGKVFGYDVNTSGIVTDSAYVQDARVYITYGDGTTVDDDVRTSFTGDYVFRGLRKGKYTIFVYSQCNSCPFNQEVVKQTVEITDNKQEVTAPDLKIFD
jgi:hypothetical protein